MLFDANRIKIARKKREPCGVCAAANRLNVKYADGIKNNKNSNKERVQDIKRPRAAADALSAAKKKGTAHKTKLNTNAKTAVKVDTSCSA